MAFLPTHLLVAAMLASEPTAVAERANGYTVFVRVTTTPGAATRELLSRHGVHGFAIDASNAALRRDLAAHPQLLIADAIDSFLRIDEAEFAPLFEEYFTTRDPRSALRPRCPQEPANAAELSRLASDLGSELGSELGSPRPIGAFLALDPSWTHRAEPFDFCTCDACATSFDVALTERHGTLDAAREAFGLSADSWPDAVPWRVDRARFANLGRPLEHVRIGPWLASRAAVDAAFAAMLERLGDAASRAIGGAPVGFAGGFPTNPFGGHDWSRLAAQSLLAPPDDPTSRDVIQSVRAERGIVLSRLLSSGGSERYARRRVVEQFLCGADGAYAIDLGHLVIEREGEEGPAPTRLLEAAGEAFAIVGSEPLRAFANGRRERPRAAIVYSPASVAAAWLLDSMKDGVWWPTRGARRDSEILPHAGAWWGAQFLLDDLGFAYRYVPDSRLEVDPAALDGIELLVLPRQLVMTGEAERAIRSFVARGGRLLADSQCGLFDAGGRGRERAAFDDLLGLRRDAEAPFESVLEAAVERGTVHPQAHCIEASFDAYRVARGADLGAAREMLEPLEAWLDGVSRGRDFRVRREDIAAPAGVKAFVTDAAGSHGTDGIDGAASTSPPRHLALLRTDVLPELTDPDYDAAREANERAAEFVVVFDHEVVVTDALRESAAGTPTRELRVALGYGDFLLLRIREAP
jgi:hypothetical protein